ncbi:MAG: TSUP family transporter [Armatimonadota bacterium]
MSQPRSDWLFQTLRGLVLLVLGWAFGAFYGLSSLGLHSVFLAVGNMLLGFSQARANTAGWIVITCACVGAIAAFSQYLPFHPLILLIWATYIVAGLAGNAIVPRQRRASLRVYLLLLLMAVGAGMIWQAYPTLSTGVFRTAETSIVLPAQGSGAKTALAGLIAGLLGGMLGLGGGYVLFPALVMMGVSAQVALWLSIWLMLPLTAVSAVANSRRSATEWSQEGWLGAGAFLGGVAGATWALSFSPGMLVFCFGVALTAASLVTWRLVALIEKASATRDD